MKFFTELFNLKDGLEDRSKVMESVIKNASFRGANLWILICAIVVASVGLNVNSTAVIIGAMLISPLMGPIVSSGFALALYDFGLLKKSLKNLLVATIVSLAASFSYFLLTPFKDAQSELLARTSPNIYDILIAFFGGLVGAIAVTRVEKGNPIPGVAIATALMPPLCTAGYGLANGNMHFFLEALFLYCINAVFICMATFAVIKVLKFPAYVMIDKKKERIIRLSLSLITLIILIPSVYFAFKLYNQQKYNHIIDDFFNRELISKGYTIVYKKVNYNRKPKTIDLALLRKQLSQAEIDSLNNKLNSLHIPETQLHFRQDTADRFELLRENILTELSKRELTRMEKENNNKEPAAPDLHEEFDSKQIFRETQIIFPLIDAISITKSIYYSGSDSIPVITLLYKSKSRLPDTEKLKLRNWVKSRLSIDSLDVIEKN